MKNILFMILKHRSTSLLTIFFISIIIFTGIEILPANAAKKVSGQVATPEPVNAFRKELKLDLSPNIRYAAWLSDIAHGNFGNSRVNGRPVSELIVWWFANTILLALFTSVIAIPLSIILGVMREKQPNYCSSPRQEYTNRLLASVPEMDPNWLDNLLKKRS